MTDPRRPYATLAAVRSDETLRFAFAGYSAPNARTVSTVKMLQHLLAGPHAVQPSGRSTCFVQYDDYAHHEIVSAAYGRRTSGLPTVSLILDAFFYDSQGYAETRRAAEAGLLPPWRDRRDVAFWRGSSSTRWVRDDGEEIIHISQIPRVALCDRLRGQRRSDAAIFNVWGGVLPEEASNTYLQQRALLRPYIPMREHAHFKILIDIDGVANAWSFFEKLLMGSCILKVLSPFEQWYYGRLVAWVHYVPVAEDLSDLDERLEWCWANDAEARRIAEGGQRFALSTTFDAACAEARATLAACALPL